MGETRWWIYVQTVAGKVQAIEVANKVGIDKSNVTRWKQGNRPAVEFVLKFARSYDRPVVEALAEAEYITDAEARIREVKINVQDLSDVALARELLSRAEARAAAAQNVIHGRFGRNVGADQQDDVDDAVARVTDPEPTDEQ
ncbi:hypothetical protein [Microbacterium sp. 22242]|uniref:hypothetical protein n=1 Tax=Microbacterium sp. 22242 TaxID=3453896 RepID=UPI003F87399A